MGLFDSINRAVGDLTGGIIGSSSAERAVGGMQEISEEAKQQIMSEAGASWEDIQGLLEPYMADGEQLMTQYNTAMGNAPDAPVFEGFSFDPSKMEENPAYQFIKEQTMQGVTRLGAKNRALTSGNLMQEMARQASGLASTEYGNEFQRQLQTYKTGQDATARNFDVRNLLNRQRIGDIGSLMTQGANVATNLGSFRSNLANMRAGALSNRAAENTAATLLPIQERQNFIQGLMSAGGRVAGGMASGGTGFFA